MKDDRTNRASCIVHQPDVMDTLDVVFHVAQMVYNHLPAEVVAFGILVGDHLAKHQQLPPFSLQDKDGKEIEVSTQVHLNLQVAQNINAMRAQYMICALQAAFGQRLAKDDSAKLDSGFSTHYAKIVEVDNVCGMCESDLISSAYGMMVRDMIATGDFKVEALTAEFLPDNHKDNKNPDKKISDTSSFVDADGSIRLISQHDLNSCGLGDGQDGAGTGGVALKSGALSSASELRRLCWAMAADALDCART